MTHDTVSLTIDPRDRESVRRALQTEWLLTNGLGGYAMGTALGANTRRYHGLLIAATQPPVGRLVALHSIIENIVVKNEIHDLSTHQFGVDGLMHPKGWQHLRRMIIEPNCRVQWQYQIDKTQITKTVAPLANRNGISLHYVIRNAAPGARLMLRPLLTMRDFHALSRADGDVGRAEVDREALVRIRIADQELRWFGQSHAWTQDHQWWQDFHYAHDRARGQDFLDDQWSPGSFDCAVAAGPECRLSFAIALDSAIPSRVPPIEMIEAPRCDRVTQQVRVAASQFLVQRRAADRWGTSVVAGYPWFGDWGRDTMIAIPGLMIATNRLAEARACLATFAHHLHHGLIPNLFDDYGHGAHYNSVDASLWFVHAVHQLWKVSQHSSPGPSQNATALDSDDELIRACRTIIESYRRGTDFNIRMDDDGLISAGDETTQLTWMDAKRDGVVFTPRHGKAVEINALWFNALHCLALMSDDDMERRDLVALSETVAASFRAQFWWPERTCLYDVLGNRQLRPNQIFAVSLPHSPLTLEQQRAVVHAVGDQLLTPFGLRTLEQRDEAYRGRFQGSMFERDRAYHNGTVWPWLIGPYCEALLRVHNFNAASQRKVRTIIQPLLHEMRNTEGGRCIGQIAEVYDGDPPHRPAGCPAQAWSVAEVLRIATLVE